MRVRARHVRCGQAACPPTLSSVMALEQVSYSVVHGDCETIVKFICLVHHFVPALGLDLRQLLRLSIFSSRTALHCCTPMNARTVVMNDAIHTLLTNTTEAGGLMAVRTSEGCSRLGKGPTSSVSATMYRHACCPSSERVSNWERGRLFCVFVLNHGAHTIPKWGIARTSFDRFGVPPCCTRTRGCAIESA